MWASKQKQAGFTIVELLIVIVVIGILASITIVAYNGVRSRANDTSVQSDLSQLAKQFGLFYASNGVYPSTPPDLQALDVSINKNAYWLDAASPYNLVPCVTPDLQQYSITAIPISGKRLYVANGGGVQEYTGATAWTGASNYGPMCASTLSGSAVISSGSGYAGSWRTWTNG
jgi:general secretion pathway protein G